MNKTSLTVLTSGASLIGALTLCSSAAASQFVDGPDDQSAQAGTSTALLLEPRVANLSYQWYRQWPDQSQELAGETNKTLKFSSVQISDVGLYFCRVTHGSQSEYTSLATLYVTTGSSGSDQTLSVSSSTPLSTKSLSLSGSGSFSLLSLDGGSEPLTLWGPPVTSGGGSGTCPGPYAGYVNYKKTIALGWGYAPDTNNTTVYTATDNTRTDTKVEYVGKMGDNGCDQTTVTVPYPACSSKYRFTIYFPNNVPTTNAYPISLVGFLP